MLKRYYVLIRKSDRYVISCSRVRPYAIGKGNELVIQKDPVEPGSYL